MVDNIAARGVRDAGVLAALARVPRHEFVPAPYRHASYEDQPLPIGRGQTISQPYIVGLMSEALSLLDSDSLLEIGTGSGYQTAILAQLARCVHTLEIIPELASRARATLERLGYGNVQLHAADGHVGWPDAAPYDAILLTAAPENVPPALLEQLAPGGRLVLPVGLQDRQTLQRIVRRDSEYEKQDLADVRFVPMTGTTPNAE